MGPQQHHARQNADYRLTDAAALDDWGEGSDGKSRGAVRTGAIQNLSGYYQLAIGTSGISGSAPMARQSPLVPTKHRPPGVVHAWVGQKVTFLTLP